MNFWENFGLQLVIWTAVSAAVYASFAEHAVHRFVMHRNWRFFSYPFEAHAKVHHQVFKADGTYHLGERPTKLKETIPMAWWNGPVLVLLASIPWLIASMVTDKWSIVTIAVVVIAAYYGIYERLHWCMHLPKSRRVEMTWIFRKLNGHHLLHHRYMRKNFNVVLPVADLFWGTLLLRSKLRFAQATGPSVPCVQPKKRTQS